MTPPSDELDAEGRIALARLDERIKSLYRIVEELHGLIVRSGNSASQAVDELEREVHQLRKDYDAVRDRMASQTDLRDLHTYAKGLESRIATLEVFPRSFTIGKSMMVEAGKLLLSVLLAVGTVVTILASAGVL